MKEQLLRHLRKTALNLGIDQTSISLDYPEDPEHGEFSTNIALASAKALKTNPRALAEKIVAEYKKDMPDFVGSVSVAGAGFINFEIKDEALARQAIIGQPRMAAASKGHILIEYTDPNIFKVFHIGHLMSNAIGESISRLIEHSGTKVTRLCYPADIGLHIAKSIWAMQKHMSDIPADSAPIQEKTSFLGKMYVEGTQAYEADKLIDNGITAKDDIDALNKIVYERSSPAVNALYEKGRRWSLEHFDILYERLGTKFDASIYESEMAPIGLEIVHDFAKKGVFEESDGAIVFKGEKYGLHTRVFINSHGLPTYEAKEMGLNVTKFERYPDIERSIIVTASEQNEYFKVVIKALSLIDENIGAKTVHIGHGMLRFATGKMSSRTGKVITAESLIDEMKALVKEKMVGRQFSADEEEKIADAVAIGAIKYTILRQAVGSDVIFDSAKSISFEGDSGPYLQYSAVRAAAVLEKAGKEGVEIIRDPAQAILPEKAGQLEKLIIRFSDIVERASLEYAPQQVANYLIELAGAFNSFYGNYTIVDMKEPLSPYRVALTKSFLKTMTDGLWLLGIKVPEKM
jgi:arginyl-tRNA synthetase